MVFYELFLRPGARNFLGCNGHDPQAIGKVKVIEPKNLSNWTILCLLIVHTWQLRILVTALFSEILQFHSAESWPSDRVLKKHWWTVLNSWFQEVTLNKHDKKDLVISFTAVKKHNKMACVIKNWRSRISGNQGCLKQHLERGWWLTTCNFCH